MPARRPAATPPAGWIAQILRLLRLVARLLGTPARVGRPVPTSAASAVAELFRRRQSDIVVTASGQIVKLLPDDLEDRDGTGQHQRFLVELPGRDRLTVKVAHNLKFGRVPAREGRPITVHGEYQWTPLGGTVHWTHHDPKRWHEDGWIEYEGRRYG